MTNLYSSGTNWGTASVNALRRHTTDGGGIDSLLNEVKMPFKRGQKISYKTNDGKVGHGTYVMASSVDGYVVLNTGGRHGTPKVVPLTAIDTIVSWKK